MVVFLDKELEMGSFPKILPDAHSDFIYALIGEEFGFKTAFSVFFFYIMIYVRIYLIFKITKNFFILNSLIGLGNIFIFQSIINISSSLNLMPTKGMTLPFVSYLIFNYFSSLIIGFILTLINYEKINKKIFLVAGGIGGHLFPAIAVAQKDKENRYVFIIDKKSRKNFKKI